MSWQLSGVRSSGLAGIYVSPLLGCNRAALLGHVEDGTWPVLSSFAIAGIGIRNRRTVGGGEPLAIDVECPAPEPNPDPATGM